MHLRNCYIKKALLNQNLKVSFKEYTSKTIIMSDMQKELINTQQMLCEERQEAYQFRKDLGDIMEKYDHSRDEQIDLFLETILKENYDYGNWCAHDQRELDRLSELEHIIWTDFYREKEVIDDTKAYILSRDFQKIKKEHHGYKKGYERLTKETEELKAKLEAERRRSDALADACDNHNVDTSFLESS